MNKLTAALAATFISVTMITNQAFAVIALPPPPPPPTASAAHGSAGGIAAGAGVIIGIAAFLSAYDLYRRTTCSGDFLYLGGPGFTEKLSTGNVLVPQCPLVVRHKR